MLEFPKRYAAALVDWVDDQGGGVSAYEYLENNVIAPLRDPAMQFWQAWRVSRTWPGDWLKMPLWLLAKMHFIDFVIMTWKHYRDEQRKWSDLTATQVELIRWLEV